MHVHYGGDLSLGGYLVSEAYGATWRTGAWVSHLWFLIYLLIYYAAVYLILKLRPAARALARGAAWLDSLSRYRLVGGGYFIVALPLLSVAMLAAAMLIPWAYDKAFGVVSLQGLLTYLPYFAFGMFGYFGTRVFEAFGRFRWWLIPLTILAYWARLEFRFEPTSLAEQIVSGYIRALLPWLLSYWVFVLFQWLCAQPSRFFAYLSDGSYTIYLFHHFCVIVFAMLLIDLAWPIWAKYGLIVVATFATTVAIHHFLILRIGLLRLMFNGKRLAAAGR